MAKHWIGYRIGNTTIHEHNPDFEVQQARVAELLAHGVPVSTWDEEE